VCSSINQFPELKAVLRTTSDKLLAASGPDKKLLQETFAELMTADATMIQTQLQKLVARIQSNTDFLSKCVRFVVLIARFLLFFHSLGRFFR
jgi:hypothetical protein